MRRPNGYGTVVKLSGNRRRPYMVRKTAGYNEKGQQIFTVIGYYATQEEALHALAEYNHNPYDLDRAKFTFKQLYDDWSINVAPTLGKSNRRAMKSAYGHCKSIENIPYRNLRKHHMQSCIDNCGLSQSAQGGIRSLFVKLDAYAYDMDIITKQYSSSLTTKETEKVRDSVPFTNDEIKVLWDNNEEEVLFLLYTGMRLSEAATLPTACISDGIIRYGLKTKAGKGRYIPVHPKIAQIVEKRMKNELLIGSGVYANQNLYHHFRKVMDKYGMKHHPHDCRHTFRSELDRQGANKVCIDLLMGHASADVGERVYTHKRVEELKEAIELLKYGK